MPTKNEWTVMFFFAGDNDLSPLVVPQIKAIKDAGFQARTEVLVYFDTNEKGVPTKIYNVNDGRKIRKEPPQTEIGDGTDPFVRNMTEDNIDANVLATLKGKAAAALKEALATPDKQTAPEALTNFLNYCRENHSANHFILFLVGHGMIVGNDSFLPDENPVSAITLKELAKCLEGFSNGSKSSLELLAFHSCSMSAIEISWELKGLANYMLSTQGVSFVGSWPYRQLLKKALGSVDKLEQGKSEALAKGTAPAGLQSLENQAVLTLLEKLYFLSLFNATDFITAGYSQDLSLTNLQREVVEGSRPYLESLIAELKKAITDSWGQELVLQAHWEAQSFWQEDYIDLVDFCFCLRKRCLADVKTKGTIENVILQTNLAEAAKNVIEYLRHLKSDPITDRFARFVVRSDNFGWKVQYSHGLSIYFPWSEPLGDVNKSIIANYSGYAFTQEFAEGTSWLSFLREYFDKTMRKTRRAEEQDELEGIFDENTDQLRLMGFTDLNPFGALGDDPKPTPALSGDPGKSTPAQGGGCSCPSIKNYPASVKSINGREQRVRDFAITGGAFRAGDQIE